MSDLKTFTLFLLMVLAASCTSPEPPFSVKGDAMITKDIKVNIGMIKDTSTSINTAFYNGENYDTDNQKVIRYIIYVSYKNFLFYRSEVDNLHGKIKGAPINEILITKKDGGISALYRPLKESDTSGGTALEPSNIFFMKRHNHATEKRKFTALYKSKEN